MSLLDRDGVTVSYRVHGTDSGWPPVLLSHGYAASADMWRPNVDVLAADRQVITWDIRGHGASDSPEDLGRYTEESSVADMAAILDAAGVERAVVGGLSLGGYLSLAFYLRHPERVTALMLFDTGPGFRKSEPRAAWNETAERYAVSLETRGLAGFRDRPEVAMAEHRGAAGLAMAARGILTQHDDRVITSLTSVDVPTLVLAGTLDAPFLPALDYMAARIPKSTKVVIEGAGHAANIDRPDEFNRAVIAFLQTL